MIFMDSGLFSQQGTPIPLSGVRVQGDVAGQGGRITVSQRFKNQEKQAVEAVYKFPLPEGAAVCGFTVEKEGARISGNIEERDKAFEIFDDALQEGKGGYLLDEERPNIFTLCVGNLNPGTEALIHMEYVTLIDGDGDTLRFILPTTITPRYIPDHQKDDGDIPLNDRIHPPFARSVPYGMQVHLTLTGADGFSAIESPSHPIRIEHLSEQQDAASFAQESVQMDRDFVLTMTLRDPGASQAFACRKHRAVFAELDLFLADEEQARVKAENIFFVVDCSGSMQGDSIHEARQALDVCLKAVEEGMRFNIIRFGSHFESLFSEPKPYSENTQKQALSWAQDMQADLGGTEIFSPLQHLYQAGPGSNGRKGAILLLTDGAVSNEDDVVALVRRHSSLRMFPVGIGAGCNELFIKGLARAGKGASAFIYLGERLAPKILNLFGKMSEHGIAPAVNWGPKQVDQTPAHPVVYTRTRTSLFARFETDHEPAGEIQVSADVQGSPLKWTVPVLPVEEACPAIPLLWAREKIRELEEAETEPPDKGSRRKDRQRASLSREIIALSKTYGILSKYTSFVAVEEREEKDLTTGEVLLRKIPVPVTMGWHGLGSTGSAFLTAAPPSGSRPLSAASSAPEAVCEGSRAFFLSEEDEVRFHIASKDELAFDMIMATLYKQQAGGGFAVDNMLALNLGINIAELMRASEEIIPLFGKDSLTLLWSAVLLQVLEQRFSEHRKSWEKVVKKTRKWVQKSIKKQKTTIQGQPLESWAAHYVATHNPADEGV